MIEVSIVIKGPTCSGKTVIAEAILDLFLTNTLRGNVIITDEVYTPIEHKDPKAKALYRIATVVTK